MDLLRRVAVLALAAALASACASTAGKPVPTHEPSPAPATSAVPGILLPPSTPIPLPTEVSLIAPSADVVWVLVEGSLLYRSTNQGTSWQQRPIPPGSFPNPEISFIDDHEGWLASGGVPETQCNGAGTTVWHTLDGGSSWQQVASADYQRQVPGGIGYRQCKQGLSFVDAMHGFLAASDPNSRPIIYRTADGGHSWTPTTLPDPPGFISQAGGFTLQPGLVKAVGKTLLIPAWGMQEGTQAAREFVFRSVDGGASWSYLATAVNPVTFVTESRWLMIANNRSALETTDSGRTWHAFPSDYENAAGVASVFVFGAGLVGYGTVRGGIQRTIDGGLHWELIRTPAV